MMKKIFFLLPLLSVFGLSSAILVDSPSDCSCGDGSTMVKVSGYDAPREIAYPESDPGEVTRWLCDLPDLKYSHYTSAGPFVNSDDDTKIYYIVYEDLALYRCYGCDDPDELYPAPPSGDLITSKNSCQIDQLTQADQQCEDANGTWYATEKKDCCTSYVCIATPPPPPPCEEPMISQPLGGCACPPDTYPVVASLPDGTPYETCLPNSDCSPDMIYTPGIGCTCPAGTLPDQNSIGCLPLPPDTNDTPPDDACPPGQFDCNGQCQLIGVPCYDPDDGDGPLGGDDPNDPCSYAFTSNDMPYQGTALSEELCQNLASIFGSRNYSYLKNNDCSFGACYYGIDYSSPDTNITPPPPSAGSVSGTLSDGNSTQNLDLNLSNLTGAIDRVNNSVINNGMKLDKLNTSLNNQANRLNSSLASLNLSANGIKDQVKSSGDQISNTLNSLNESLSNEISQSANGISGAIASAHSGLGGKLDAIKASIDAKDLNVTVENNLSVDLNETNDLLRDINKSLSGDIDMDALNSKLADYDARIAESDALFDDALLSVSTTISDLQAFVSGATPPVVSYGGDCNICFTTSFVSTCLNFDSTASLRPYFQFFLNVILAFLTIRLWVGIIRDLVKYLIYL